MSKTIVVAAIVFVILIIVIWLVSRHFSLSYWFSKLTGASTINYSVGEPEYTFSVSPVFSDIISPTSVQRLEEIILVTTKAGVLYRMTGGARAPLLDLKKEIANFDDSSEGGLMCVAADPNFRDNQKIYLTYTVKSDEEGMDMDMILSAYVLNQGMSFVEDIIRISFTQNIHHAGTIQFDGKNDRAIYMSTGDGGPQEDPGGYSQNMDSLRGKMLRIDLDTGDAKIIALGLRNPWRFSIDESGRMFIADVGYGKVESVYLVEDLDPEVPYNFGWNFFEGGRTPMSPRGRGYDEFVQPIFEYENSSETGRAIIGGVFPGKDGDVRIWRLYRFCSGNTGKFRGSLGVGGRGET